MVTIKLNNKKYLFSYKTEAAKFILKTCNNKNCIDCNNKIHLTYDKVYNRLRHNYYDFEQKCINCFDNRFVRFNYTIIWKVNNTTKSKTIYTNKELTKLFKTITIKCNCGRNISTMSRLKHIDRYINKNVIDTTNWLCKKCIAKKSIQSYNNSSDMNILQLRKENSIKNGKHSGKNLEVQNNRARTQAYSRYKDITELSFYVATIAEDKTVYKIGITRDLTRRKKNFSLQYTWAKILLTSNKEKIIELEYAAKMKFQLSNYKYGTEFIKKENLIELKKFVTEFNQNYYKTKL